MGVVRGYNSDRVKTDKWQHLVRLGIADALCQCLLDITDSPYSEITDEGQEIVSATVFGSHFRSIDLDAGALFISHPSANPGDRGDELRPPSQLVGQSCHLSVT